MSVRTPRLRGGMVIAARMAALGAAALGRAIFGFSLGLAAGPALAAGGRQSPLIIAHDRGGLLGQRSAEVRQIAQSGQRVELRGTCLSACTLYLGVPDVCVAPGARFGFHGPSWHGTPLIASEFERWSQLMASHYREPLRSWYLQTARHRITGHYELSGASLIGMGYARC